MAPRTPSRTRNVAQAGRRGARGLFRSHEGNPDAFGSERSFSPEIGKNWDAEDPVRGFYIDFSFKAESPQWPPPRMPGLSEQLHVATVQWGLGAYERFLDGQGEGWLEAANRVGEHLIEIQQRGGAQDGGFRHFFPMPHTYRIDPPWLSGITQGEAASLLVRLYRQSGEERFADAARRALLPMSVPSAEGGVLAELDGDPFVEEYPTSPASFVLNGAIFALWGVHDVGVGLGDEETRERFETLTSSLAANLHRWDTGHWSLYDLYPHPLPNIASAAYHLLHIRELEVLDRLSPRPELARYRDRFQQYRSSALERRRSTARKVAFRLVVPRNAALSHRLPWNTATRDDPPEGGRANDTLVLCYHAVSEEWRGPLAVTPAALEEQLRRLGELGFRAITFAEAIAHAQPGKTVVITFDDGYRSVSKLAKPILDRLGMTATVFVPSDLIGLEQPMSWPGIEHWLRGPRADELTPMSWPEAAALVADGWEIGSHTRTHPQLTKLDDERLREELVGSRQEIEARLGRPCETLAFPYGDADRRVAEAAMAAGYAGAAALSMEPDLPTPFCWSRVGIYRVDGERSFQLKISPSFRRLQRSRPGGRSRPECVPSGPATPRSASRCR